MIQKYNVSKKGDMETITLFEDGKMYTATSSHPNWAKILTKTQNGEPAGALFNINATVKEVFLNASEKFTYVGGKLLYKNEPLLPSLEETIAKVVTAQGNMETVANLILLSDGTWDYKSLNQMMQLVETGDVEIDKKGNCTLYAPTYLSLESSDEEKYYRVNKNYTIEQVEQIGNVLLTDTHHSTFFATSANNKTDYWVSSMSGSSLLLVDGEALTASNTVLFDDWSNHHISITQAPEGNLQHLTLYPKSVKRLLEDNTKSGNLHMRPVNVNLTNEFVGIFENSPMGTPFHKAFHRTDGKVLNVAVSSFTTK